MKKIQYGDILKRAFLITWNNKFLWIFGLFIFLGSLGSNINFNAGKISETNEKIQSAISFIQNNFAVTLATSLGILAVIVLLFLLRLLGMAAIIKSISNLSVYGQSKIKIIFSEAREYLWRLLLLEIIISLGLFLMFLVLLGPVSYLFMLKADTLAVISSIIAALIFLPLLLLAYFLRKYAYFYIVLGNVKIKVSLELAYSLLRKNIRESLVMGCAAILAAIAFTVSVCIFLVISALLIAALGLLLYFLLAKTSAVIICALGCAIEAIIFLLLSSWYFSFMQTAWVLFFQDISLEKQTEKKLTEKLESAKEIPAAETI
jgi:hypothetical protein